MNDSNSLQRGAETSFVQGLGVPGPDPFQPKSRKFWSSFINAVLATALFRCWHILIFFGAWATAICVISNNVYSLSISPTLLTVIGTVLGFVISYRTTSSFERYNEGRRLWSQIILASRTFARTVWFHVPAVMPAGPSDQSISEDEKRSRVIIEKKTVINLLEAFAIAVKHYLRGEDGIYYQDLYHLVKFLPSYALPAGLPSANFSDMNMPSSPTRQNRASDVPKITSHIYFPGPALSHRPATISMPHLPLPASSPQKKVSFPQIPPTLRNDARSPAETAKESISVDDDVFLLPARMPPKYALFDFFPFSLLVKLLTRKGKEGKGKWGSRMRARSKRKGIVHNLPLEISLYLSSYIAALQKRKAIDPPTATSLLASLNQLVDALTGLERIVTTPIPFSYAIHLWVVTIVYCLLLPFQVWATLKWLTIPATVLASFIFFGFLAAGEEIENPFDYDKNDLNMDHFTNNIIKNELHAITAYSAPDPAIWAFSRENDFVFAARRAQDEERLSPEDWVRRGQAKIQAALSLYYI